MIKIFIQIIKTSLFIFAVLIASQIPLHGVRICDHVGNLIHVNQLKKGTEWISKKVDLKAITSATIPQENQNADERISATNKTSPTHKGQAREKISDSEKRDLKKILERLQNSD